MSVWDKYPYTDFHELNLDWIIKKIKEVTKEIDDFKVVNRIVWGGLHDPGKEYPRWCIVDTPTHEGYISIQPVPAGITIGNEDYWRQVANYSALYADFQNRIIALENTVGDSSSGLVKDVNDLQSAVYYLTPEMYGAVGDGVIDDTQAIIDCINACPVHGMIVMHKTYAISSTIDITKPMTITGAYSGYDIEESTDNVTNAEYRKVNLVSSAGAFLIHSVGVTIRDIGIVVTGSDDAVHFSDLSDVNSPTKVPRNNTFRNIMIWNRGTGEAGFSADVDVITTTFDQVRIYGGQYGFKLGNVSKATTSLAFNNCWVINVSKSAYKLSYASYCTFNACACDNATATMERGYDFDHCHTITIAGCGVEGTKLAGIEVVECVGIHINLYGYRVNDDAVATGGFCVCHGSTVTLDGCLVSPATPMSHRLLNVIDDGASLSRYTILNCKYEYITLGGTNYQTPNKDYVGIMTEDVTISTDAFGMGLIGKQGYIILEAWFDNSNVVALSKSSTAWAAQIRDVTGATVTNSSVTFHIVYIKEDKILNL